MLVTFWLPMVHFSELEEKNKDYVKESTQIRTIHHKIDSYTTVFIDSLGFYYIDTKKTSLEENIYEYLVKNLITLQTKALIEATFLNKKIMCKEDNDFSKFLKEIALKYHSIDELTIDKIKERFEDKKEKSYIKFTLSNPESYYGNFHSILNRNLEKLLQKSLFYTHGVEFDTNEIYNLSIFDKEKIEELKNTLKIIASKNNQPINTEKLKANIIKKAIQDTIEEHTILNFLSKTKRKYITKIYDKITLANHLVDKIQSQILAVERIFSKSNKSCYLTTEEDLEIFIEDILQSLPKFNALDTKIKTAYYIKIGNVTTESSVNQNETIEHTLFYQKWKSSLNYFKSMAYELKEILTLYHQNKSIKELENIAYYENYKSDIDDIKSIQLKDESQNFINEKGRKYLEYIILGVAITALAGEAPLIDKNVMEFIWPISKNSDDLLLILRNFTKVFLNLMLYFIIFMSVYKHIIIKFKLYKYFSLQPPKNEDGYFYFDSTDYDKHEHRSSKPLRVYSPKECNNLAQISYNELQSAYFLMKKLKNYKLTKYYNGNIFKFSLFPSILKQIDIRENYRISRNDKVTTHILFRYKITQLKLSEFLNKIKEDDFNPYYNEIVKDKSPSVEEIISHIENSIEDLDSIKLNLYVVYSFILKLDKNKKSTYTYTIVKDQYRIHYHINKLPKKCINKFNTQPLEKEYKEKISNNCKKIKECNKLLSLLGNNATSNSSKSFYIYTPNKEIHNCIEYLQEKIAELVYIHFLARIKNFDYLNKERKCEKEN